MDDTTEVIDLIVDRMLELQIDEGLPVYVIPIHTPERVATTLATQSAAGRSPARGTVLLA
ncbi:MAG: hypothetical protein ACRDI2_22870 [Chloroflexota bacterium]